MCRLLPLTKILHCPQCIKAKINSSIKGRSYLKHLIFFFFFFEISFTPANVSSQNKKIKKQKTKDKKHKQKQKQKAKRKKKLKQIWYDFIRLFQNSLSILIGRNLQ